MASAISGPITPPRGTRNSPLLNTNSPVKAAAAATGQNHDDSAEAGKDEDATNDADKANGFAPSRRRTSRSPTPLTAENLNLFNATAPGMQETGHHDSNLGMFDLGMSQEDEDINADDDDYNGVDQISDASDQSDAFEKAVEREILAEGEHGIDWDDEATFHYNDSWEANQYSLAVDFGEPQSILEQELHQRRPEPTIPPHSEPLPADNLSTFLKGTPLDEDWSSSSSSSSDAASQADDADDERRDSRASAASAASIASNGSHDQPAADVDNESSSGDETDDDVPPRRETVSTPAISLSRTNSRRRIIRAPGVRSSIEITTPNRNNTKPGRFGVMRKFVINPNKAVAFSSPDPASPGGRTIHFNAPKNRNVNWVSRHTSRSSSMSAPRTPMNEEHARTLTDTINGRLFQRFNCTPEALAALSGHANSDYGGTSMFSRSRLMQWNSTSSLPSGVLAELEGAELDDSAHEEFFDFDAGSVAADNDEPSQLDTPMPPPPRPLDMSSAKGRLAEPDTPTPSVSRQMPPSSPLARMSRPQRPELGAPFKESPAVKGEPKTPESDFAVPATASSSPRKRRGSHEAELATTLTPVMKRQRF